MAEIKKTKHFISNPSKSDAVAEALVKHFKPYAPFG
jgi:hypothetical protein